MEKNTKILSAQEQKEIENIFFEKIKKYNNSKQEKFTRIVLYKGIIGIIISFDYSKGWKYKLELLDNE